MSYQKVKTNLNGPASCHYFGEKAIESDITANAGKRLFGESLKSNRKNSKFLDVKVFKAEGLSILFKFSGEASVEDVGK